MSLSTMVQQFVSGLKSKNRDVQNKASQDLLLFAKTELREMPPDESAHFFDEFNHYVFDMMSSQDSHEKKAGVIAVNCLISGDVVNTTTRISRYMTHVRNLLLSNDVAVLEMAAKTMVKLNQLPGTKGAETFEFNIRLAFEWLSGERENSRHSAVLVLRELAVAMPTYFYQQVGGFFDGIFKAIGDPKPIIREGAGQALQAALLVTAQRENLMQNSTPTWYQTCYNEAMSCFGEVPPKEKGVTKDDRVHGALIVLNELLRVSNGVWEKKYIALKGLQPERKRIATDEYSANNPKTSLIDKLTQQTKLWSASNPEYDGSSASRITGHVQESAVCRQLILSNFKEICAKVGFGGTLWVSHKLIILISPLSRSWNKRAVALFTCSRSCSTSCPASLPLTVTTLSSTSSTTFCTTCWPSSGTRRRTPT